MKVIGLITKAMPVQSGISRTGKEWRRQSLILTYDNTNPQYPKSIVFDVLGDKIEKLQLCEGGRYELEIDFEAREWNGRYFLQASCWKAAPLDAETATQQATQPVAAAPAAPPVTVYAQPAPQPAADDEFPF